MRVGGLRSRAQHRERHDRARERVAGTSKPAPGRRRRRRLTPQRGQAVGPSRRRRRGGSDGQPHDQVLGGVSADAWTSTSTPFPSSAMTSPVGHVGRWRGLMPETTRIASRPSSHVRRPGVARRPETIVGSPVRPGALRADHRTSMTWFADRHGRSLPQTALDAASPRNTWSTATIALRPRSSVDRATVS